MLSQQLSSSIMLKLCFFVTQIDRVILFCGDRAFLKTWFLWQMAHGNNASKSQ